MKDEKTIANRVLKYGFQDGNITSPELLSLAKHYRQEGFGEKNIKNKLDEFCRINVAGYDSIDYYETINYVARKAAKNQEFATISDVDVYKKELDAIQKLNDFKGQQILFSMLVFAKAQFSIKSLQEWDTNSFLLASGTRIYYSEFEKKYVHQFRVLGLVEADFTRGREVNYFYRINFSKKSGDVVITVGSKEIEFCGQIFKELVDGDWICQDCGEYFWRESNRQVRCETCGIEADRAKKRKYWHKNKEN